MAQLRLRLRKPGRGPAAPRETGSRVRLRPRRLPAGRRQPPLRRDGPVFLRYEKRERRGPAEFRRYSIGGPGLSDAKGTLWADAARGHVVEFELPIPDEPGFVDGRLRLLEVKEMTSAEWEAFKRSRLGE